MKTPLKLLLILSTLIVGVYAAVPLWMPQILDQQLPTGWKLETAKIGYPGITGINISKLSITGEMPVAGLALTATDIRFHYKGWKTAVSALAVDVFMRVANNNPDTSLKLDDLSIPVARLTEKLHELSIDSVQVALHAGKTEPGNKPLILNFRSIELVPGPDKDFHLSAKTNIEEVPGVVGKLDISVSPDNRNARLRFPANETIPAWLNIALQQSDSDKGTTTQIHSVFDSGPMDQQWLNELLPNLTDGQLSQIAGSFEARMDFAGNDSQNITHFSLATEGLLAELDTGIVVIDASLFAERNGEGFDVVLSRPAEIKFQGAAAQFNDFVGAALPELQLTSQSPISALIKLGANSNVKITAIPTLSLRYTGDININVLSDDFATSLQSLASHVDVKDFANLETSLVKGLVEFSWKGYQPMIFTTDKLQLKAGKQTLTAAGQLKVDQREIKFNQVSRFQMQLEELDTKLQSGSSANPAWLELLAHQYTMQGGLELDLSMSKPEPSANISFEGPITANQLAVRIPGNKQSPDTTIEATEMSLSTHLSAADSLFISTGSGTFRSGQISSPATSVSELALSWQNLDLLKMTGTLQSRTQGFTTELDGETWSGFDFDMAYDFPGGAEVNGSGLVKFGSDLDLTFGFKGNYDTQWWEIELHPATIPLTQIGDLLGVAHVDIPQSVILSDGYIDLHGQIRVDDEINANIDIKGHDMTATMQESSANKAGFSFAARYGNSISANGPITIETVALAGGIEMTNISADLKLESADATGLENIYAEALDGQLVINKLRISGSKIEDTTAKLSHISLQRLLEYADIGGLDGSGYLDISLPVGSDDIGAYVKDGVFKSTGPGHLAYSQTGVAASNIGLQALENFQYSNLSGGINYQSDGTYKITVRLEGNNPDLYSGHPIVFNLTIGGLLPELFESMFMTGNFEESILNRIDTNQP